MAKSPYRPFTPKPEQLALMPATSGNTINGMGESEFRRASRVYWHDPETIEHGELQKWFYTQDPDNPAIVKARAGTENRRTTQTARTAPEASTLNHEYPQPALAA